MTSHVKMESSQILNAYTPILSRSFPSRLRPHLTNYNRKQTALNTRLFTLLCLRQTCRNLDQKHNRSGETHILTALPTLKKQGPPVLILTVNTPSAKTTSLECYKYLLHKWTPEDAKLMLHVIEEYQYSWRWWRHIPLWRQWFFLKCND